MWAILPDRPVAAQGSRLSPRNQARLALDGGGVIA
jgi:hypothetical protein